jgi:predicted ATP-dependent protease
VRSPEQLTQMLAQREWREGYLADRMQDEILLEQILVETEGERVGQINALSVIEFPGIRARSGNRPVSAALCTLAMASLPTSNAKPSWAATFTPKA